jgi:hypothetical protein
MRTLPVELLSFIVGFQPFFSESVWENAPVLLTGAFLAIGKRTVTCPSPKLDSSAFSTISLVFTPNQKFRDQN